jgi:ComF family protein
MTSLGFSTVSGGVRAGFRHVLDWLIPPSCLACRNPITGASGLCATCWSKLQFIEAPYCDRLGTPFPFDEGEGAISAAAIADPPPWDRARGAVIFDDLSRDLVHALKYRDRHEAAQVMARLMLRAGRDLVTARPLVVPVPLHRWRMWRRRYNQSGLLAKIIAKQSGLDFRPDLLVRVKPTRSQTGLDHKARAKNLKGAIMVPPDGMIDVKGRAVLIIDDVVTTGATAGQCARALKAAGAVCVDVLAFALVTQPRRLHI